MAFSAVTIVTDRRKGGTGYATVHARKHELNHYNDSRDRGGDNHHDLWVRIKQMVWGQYNPYLCFVRRNSRFRFGIQHDNSWLRLHSRSNNKSSQPSTVSNKHRQRNRYFVYYGIIISILTIGNPSYTEEGDCLLYTSPSPRDRTRSRMPSSA